MKIGQETLNCSNDGAGCRGPSQCDSIGHGTDGHHDFLDNNVFGTVHPGLLDIQDEASIPTLQYLHSAQARAVAVYDCHRFYQFHSNFSQSPDCPFRLTLGVGKSAELAMSVFAQSTVSNEYGEKFINYATETVTQ